MTFNKKMFVEQFSFVAELFSKAWKYYFTRDNNMNEKQHKFLFAL